jgi:hypothetical protein
VGPPDAAGSSAAEMISMELYTFYEKAARLNAGGQKEKRTAFAVLFKISLKR